MPESHAALKKAIKEAKKKSTSVELKARKKDGSFFWVNIFFSPNCDEKGNLLNMAASALDVTKKKESERALKESEEKYRALVESSLTGIFILNPEGKIEFCNQRFANIFGYSAGYRKVFLYTDTFQKTNDPVCHCRAISGKYHVLRPAAA